MVRPTQFRKQRDREGGSVWGPRGLFWADEKKGRADPLPCFCANGAAGRSDPLPLQVEVQLGPVSVAAQTPLPATAQ